jgi:hypothetical protein
MHAPSRSDDASHFATHPAGSESHPLILHPTHRRLEVVDPFNGGECTLGDAFGFIGTKRSNSTTCGESHLPKINMSSSTFSLTFLYDLTLDKPNILIHNLVMSDLINDPSATCCSPRTRNGLVTPSPPPEGTTDSIVSDK